MTDYKKLSEERLVNACRIGDARAWNEFVERYSKLVYWSIHKTLEKSACYTEDMLKDLFQDIFHKLMEKRELENLRDAANLAKFITVLSAHCTLDRIKGYRRLQTRSQSLEDVESGSAFLQTSASLNIEERELRGVLDGILQELSEKERVCVELCCVYNRTHQEIADILQISVDTVSSVIRRTKEKIKKKLEDYGLR